MSAFCEPATTTSTSHSSVLSVQAPRPETASTMVTTSAAAFAKPSMSLTVPLEAERPAHLDPPATEVAVVYDKNLVSRREEVLDRTLESPGPARGIRKDVVLGQEDPLQILIDPGEHLTELGRAVVDDR